MNTLDNLTKIKKLDSGKVLPSIQMLGQQINQVWQAFGRVRLPKDYNQVDKVLINGMGGSALGGQILRSLFFDQLKLPVGIINSYQLPASLDKNTLYIISSYSGNTEEPLSTLAEAKRRGAKIFGIASGGKLGNWIKEGKLFGYAFKPSFNPSGQPRMGLGYSLAAQLALFKKFGLIKITDDQIKNTLLLIDKLRAKFGVDIVTESNVAKKLALALQNKVPIIIASEFLGGNAHTLANQLNENAKTFANYFQIPEIDHHLIEGLVFPKANQQNLNFVFFESKLYHPRNQIRYKITKQIVAKNKIEYSSYSLSAADKFRQSIEMLLFGSYVSFYLAVLNKINPTPIPWVDYLKTQLKKYS